MILFEEEIEKSVLISMRRRSRRKVMERSEWKQAAAAAYKLNGTSFCMLFLPIPSYCFAMPSVEWDRN